MAAEVYPIHAYRTAAGLFVAGTSVVRCLYVKSTYTYDSTDVYVSDVVAHEKSPSNRTTVAGWAVTSTATGATVDSNDIVETLTGTDTVDAFVLYEFVTNDGDSPLIIWNDSFTAFAASGVSETFQLPAGGLIAVAV